MTSPDHQLAEGLPKPPHWYTELTALLPPSSKPTTQQYDDSFYAQFPLNTIHQQFPPPPIPSNLTLSVFGQPVSMEEIIKRQALDSDTKLYRDKLISGETHLELRDEFGRLLELMINDIGFLTAQCSQLGVEGIGSVTSTAKGIIKIYRNLHYILGILRDYEFYETLIKQLEDQFDHRLRLINDVRQLAFDLAEIRKEDILLELASSSSSC